MAFRVLIAPDSFKESLSASAAAEAMARGVERAAAEFGRRVHIDLCPLSDGGEGFAEVVRAPTRGRARRATVLDAAGRSIEASWTLCGSRTPRLPMTPRLLRNRAADTVFSLVSPLPTLPGNPFARARVAVIESAEAIALGRLDPALRHPRALTSFGVGQLIGRALEAGAEVIVVGLGGTATCDGGIGMAQALGARFDLIGEPPADIPEPGELPPQGRPLTAGDLARITSIETRFMHPAIAAVQIVAACDVDNPLLGELGAARVYGPQKGATEDGVIQLDEGLERLTVLCAQAGLDVDADAPGAGAAGGLGFALATLCQARLHSGSALTARLTRLAQRAHRAHLVLTGEGRLDAQTTHGKVCARVAEIAREAGVPAIALVGSTGPGWERLRRTAGGPLDRIEIITPPGASPARTRQAAARLLEDATARVARHRLGRHV